MTTTYRLLPHLPRVPEHFVDRALEYRSLIDQNQAVYSHLSEQYRNRKLIKNNAIVNSAYQIRWDIGHDFYLWAQENITPTAYECGVAYLDGRLGSTQGAHTDQRRAVSLIYLLESGGADTSTVFYQEHNHDLVRTVPQSTCDNYDQLQVVDRVQFPVKQWVALNTQILHGVEQVDTCRISLQISTNNFGDIND
jgi:hypothetical protein